MLVAQKKVEPDVPFFLVLSLVELSLERSVYSKKRPFRVEISQADSSHESREWNEGGRDSRILKPKRVSISFGDLDIALDGDVSLCARQGHIRVHLVDLFVECLGNGRPTFTKRVTKGSVEASMLDTSWSTDGETKKEGLTS